MIETKQDQRKENTTLSAAASAMKNKDSSAEQRSQAASTLGKKGGEHEHNESMPKKNDDTDKDNKEEDGIIKNIGHKLSEAASKLRGKNSHNKPRSHAKSTLGKKRAENRHSVGRHKKVTVK